MSYREGWCPCEDTEDGVVRDEVVSQNFGKSDSVWTFKSLEGVRGGVSMSFSSWSEQPKTRGGTQRVVVNRFFS